MTTLLELWKQSVVGTAWETLNLERELKNCEQLALRPRIPADHLIFRVFRAFSDPARQIKVVLLGQDPYPEILEIPVDPKSAAAMGVPLDHDDPRGIEEQLPTISVSRACGFSFSSPHGSLPLSLRTIITEILREYPQPMVERGGRRAARPAVASDYSGDLSYLVGDGVFLLNTFLTVKIVSESRVYGTDEMKECRPRGEPMSHTSWIAFTTQVLNFIRRTCPHAVYLALGKKAADLLKASNITDAIECDHPANRFGGRNPFNGSDIFLKADALLEKRGVKKVDWIPLKVPVDTRYYDASLTAARANQITTVVATATPEVSIFEESEDEDSIESIDE